MRVFINKPEEALPSTPWPDLFHVDIDINVKYYNSDLQRFPIDEAKTSNFNINREDVAPSNKDVDLAPTTVSVCNSINGIFGKYYLKTLFDSGSTDNLIVKSAIPSKAKKHLLAQPIQMQTTNGRATCNPYVVLENTMVPELSYSIRVLKIKCFVVTLSRWTLQACTIEWYETTMHFHPQNYFNNKSLLHKVMSAEPHSVAENYSNQAAQQAYANGASKYEKTDLHKLVAEQEQLSDNEKSCLLKILLKNEELFEGLNDKQLGIFPNQEFHIDLQQGSTTSNNHIRFHSTNRKP